MGSIDEIGNMAFARPNSDSNEAIEAADSILSGSREKEAESMVDEAFSFVTSDEKKASEGREFFQDLREIGPYLVNILAVNHDEFTKFKKELFELSDLYSTGAIIDYKSKFAQFERKVKVADIKADRQIVNDDIESLVRVLSNRFNSPTRLFEVDDELVAKYKAAIDVNQLREKRVVEKENKASIRELNFTQEELFLRECMRERFAQRSYQLEYEMALLYIANKIINHPSEKIACPFPADFDSERRMNYLNYLVDDLRSASTQYQDVIEENQEWIKDNPDYKNLMPIINKLDLKTAIKAIEDSSFWGLVDEQPDPRMGFFETVKKLVEVKVLMNRIENRINGVEMPEVKQESVENPDSSFKGLTDEQIQQGIASQKSNSGRFKYQMQIAIAEGLITPSDLISKDNVFNCGALTAYEIATQIKNRGGECLVFPDYNKANNFGVAILDKGERIPESAEDILSSLPFRKKEEMILNNEKFVGIMPLSWVPKLMSYLGKNERERKEKSQYLGYTYDETTGLCSFYCNNYQKDNPITNLIGITPITQRIKQIFYKFGEDRAYEARSEDIIKAICPYYEKSSYENIIPLLRAMHDENIGVNIALTNDGSIHVYFDRYYVFKEGIKSINEKEKVYYNARGDITPEYQNLCSWRDGLKSEFLADALVR